MENKKHLLIVSYAAGMTGFCPAEWLDDKLDSCLKLGHRVILISNLSSKKISDPRVKHYRVPSLSLTDLKIEVEALKSNGEQIPKNLILWYPLVFTLGIFIDGMQKAFTNGLGGGKISWGVSSLFPAIYSVLFRKIDLIFSTGGPASAHGTALIAGLLSGKPIVAELQDPLVGEGIGRNSRSAKLLGSLEKFLVKYCRQVVFVTQKAAGQAFKRYNSNNIVCIYPGSKKFELPSSGNSANGPTKIIHLGTLYSSRNLDTFFKAVDLLVEQKQLSTDEIEFVNLGDIYVPNKDSYLSRPFVKQLPIRPRQQALEFANSFDVCLLVQHADNRSETTIPYKTYDYLNLKKNIFGLTNSPELSSILKECGHAVADISNVEEIASTLLDIVKSRGQGIIQPKNIDAVEQTRLLLNLQ